MEEQYDVIVVGAGLAGLSAALELEKFDLSVLVLEQSDRVGGRLKTDQLDGFLLDHGFQVYLDEYPTGKALLNYDELDLKAFDPGALCYADTQKFLVKDTNRNKIALARMALSPVGSFMDKIRMGNLVARLKRADLEEIFMRPEHTSYNYLRQLRFSSKIIERFFKPFFSGIFLEPELDTSSRMFEFVLKMMSEGFATIPNQGMEMIPKQLKAQLKRTEFRFHTSVKEIHDQEITVEGTEKLSAKHIILATAPNELVPQMSGGTRWRETATYYFSASKSILNQNVIALNYKPNNLINNFCVISDIAPGYAPKDKHLVSVSLRTVPTDSVEDVCQSIKNELGLSFGARAQSLEFLRNYHIKHALPVIAEMKNSLPISETKVRNGLYLAGDQMLNPSINAALKSGQLAAQQVVLDYRSNDE